MRDAITPFQRLSIEILESGKAASGKEGVANIADRPLDPPLFITATGLTREGGEMIVAASSHHSVISTFIVRYVVCTLASASMTLLIADYHRVRDACCSEMFTCSTRIKTAGEPYVGHSAVRPE